MEKGTPFASAVTKVVDARLATVNALLSYSCGPVTAALALLTENALLSYSCGPVTAALALLTENALLLDSCGPVSAASALTSPSVRLSNSPASLQLRGVQSGFSGSDPLAISVPSEKPSPSVSGLRGSVPST